MSNYSLIANTVFQPFTYQELALPLMQMQAKQEQLEDEYSKLSAQADVLEAMGANDRDIVSGAYSKYKAYSDELRARAESLLKNGLDYDSRLRLYDMKRRYSSEIVPIQNAWNKRDLENKLQIEASMKDPSLMFSRDASKTSLDWYIDNPMGGFKTINGNTIMAQVAAAAKNYSERIMMDPKEAMQLHTEDPELYYSITRYGVKPEDVQNWQNHPALKRIAEGVLAANNVTQESLGDSFHDILSQSNGYITMGMYNALGKDEVKVTKPSRSGSSSGAGSGGIAGTTMNTSQYQLPMMGSDGNHTSEQKEAMKILGGEYNKDEDKFLFKNGLQKILVGYGDSGFRAPREVELFNSDGTLKTREEFLKYADRDIDRDAKTFKRADNEKAKSDMGIKRGYNAYYDKIENALTTLGLNGTTPTKQDILDSYDILRRNNAAKFANVYNLNIDTGDWNSTSKNYSVRELAGYKDGKPVYKPDATTIGELLNKKGKNEEKINVSAHWTNVDNNPGLILATTEDGKQHRYFISAADMPEGNMMEVLENFRNAEKVRGVDSQAYTHFIEAALRSLHASLTLHNPRVNQQLSRQLTNKQLGFAGLDEDAYMDYLMGSGLYDDYE